MSDQSSVIRGLSVRDRLGACVSNEVHAVLGGSTHAARHPLVVILPKGVHLIGHDHLRREKRRWGPKARVSCPIPISAAAKPTQRGEADARREQWAEAHIDRAQFWQSRQHKREQCVVDGVGTRSEAATRLSRGQCVTRARRRLAIRVSGPRCAESNSSRTSRSPVHSSQLPVPAALDCPRTMRLESTI